MRNIAKVLCLAAVAGIVAIVACSDSSVAPAAAGSPRAAAISIEPASANLVSLGERAEFTATIIDQYGAVFPGTVEWSSSDEGVVANDAEGTVVAARNGTATLTATFEGISATAAVRVAQAPASLGPVLGSAGESQAGAASGGLILVPAEASTWPVAVRVLDSGGSPVAGVAVTFAPGEGHGVTEPRGGHNR